MNTHRKHLDELLARYTKLDHDTTHPRVLADLEHRIWDLVRITGTVKDADRNLRLWFTRNFHGKPAYYEVRAFVFKASWAHPLFDEMHKGMTTSTARLCVRRAKELAEDSDVPPETALAAILRAYNGTVQSVRDARLDLTSDAPTEKNGTSASKEFKARVLHQASQFAEHITQDYDVEPAHLQQIFTEFEASVGRVVLDLLNDLSRLKSTAKKDALARIGEGRFRNACEVLGIAAKFGAKLDMRRVTRAYRGRAPKLQQKVDQLVGAGKENSDEAKTYSDELQAVNAAYELLRLYVQQRNLGEHNGKS